MTYQDNEAFQEALLSVSGPGALIITSGGRLARALKHRYRQGQIAAGRQGWVSPDILSLNQWIRKVWDLTWPSIRPLSHLSCLALWREAATCVPPPGPFMPDLALFETLDDTYAVLVRHGIAPQVEPEPGTPLLTWRKKIMGAFEELARDCQGFHPALLPSHLREAVSRATVQMPDTIVLAAFEALPPIETALFECLAKLCTVRCFDLPEGHPQRVAGAVLPSRKQEVAWLIRQLVADAQHMPLNRIGVVIPDTNTYLAHVKQTLAEILGDPLHHSRSAFNISAGARLADRSLVQAGIVPLRFWLEGQPRLLLLSMLLSPYYARWATQRDQLARADRVWRKEGVDANFKTLLDVLSGRSHELSKLMSGSEPTLEASLRTLRDKSVRTGAQWVDTLEKFWADAGFPVISNETDSGAWGHLRTVLRGMREDLKWMSMDQAEFTGFLRHLLSRQLVHIRGSEEAGIQILGLIESRGMSFEKLYVPGLAAGSLPRPVRPLPLLSPFERHRVQGATAESQYGFAQEAFVHLLACAPYVTLVRPQAEGAEPLAPSPFWFQAVREEMPQVVDYWSAPDAVSLRAAWLQGTHKGLENPLPFPGVDPPIDVDLLPGVISVSELSTAFACPFRFCAESVLKIFPLEEFIVGISPKVRGSFLHKVLALFTARCRQRGLTKKRHRAAMVELLEECTNELIALVFAKRAGWQSDAVRHHGWMVEGRRWMGDQGCAGLLVQWLDLELQRLEDGWQWVDEESSFEGLRFDGWPFSVSGRVDRIDYHNEEGFMLWDYKSGEHPSKRAAVEDLMAPQIPVYILAAKADKIAEIKGHAEAGAPLSGGYISLRTASNISHHALTPRRCTWDEVLDRWQEAVTRLGKMLRAGKFRAEPYPVSDPARKDKACQHCDYRALCNREQVL